MQFPSGHPKYPANYIISICLYCHDLNISDSTSIPLINYYDKCQMTNYYAKFGIVLIAIFQYVTSLKTPFSILCEIKIFLTYT